MARKKPTSTRRQKIGSKPVIKLTEPLKGKRVYRKAGKLHVVSYSRDKKRKAKRTRTRSQPSYTGDLKGKRI